MRDQEIIGLQEAYLEVYEEVDTRRAPKEMLDRLNDSREGHMAQDGPNKPAYDAKQRLLKKAHKKRTEISEAQEEGRRARKRYKNAPSYAEVKAGIDAKENASAERKEARSATKKPLTPAERYEQEKAARKDKSGSFSQHRMSGSRGHGSEYQNTRSIREQLVSYLLDEGFASDEKSAEAIMGAMSGGWRDVILTEKTKKTEVAPAADEAARRAEQQNAVGAAIQANPDAFKRATESEAKRRRKAGERNL